MKRYRIISLAIVVGLATVSLAWAGSRSSAWLGVYTQAVDSDLAEAFALTVDRGAIINEIVEDSPADEAGLREDDIIIALGGERIRDDEDLIDLVSDRDPGDEVLLTVVRNGKEQKIEVALGRRPRSWRWSGDSGWFGAPRAPKAPRATKPPRTLSYYFDARDHFNGEHTYIGVTLLELSERTAKNLGGEDHGVLIDDVEEDSPAEVAGLQPGDLIVAVDGEEIYEASDIQEIIRSMDEGDIARIEVIRDRDRSTIEVEAGLAESGAYYGTSILRLPDLPDIDLAIPRMRGLHRGHSGDYDLFDSEEFQAGMEELEEEMARLKKEMRALKKLLE